MLKNALLSELSGTSVRTSSNSLKKGMGGDEFFRTFYEVSRAFYEISRNFQLCT